VHGRCSHCWVGGNATCTSCGSASVTERRHRYGRSQHSVTGDGRERNRLRHEERFLSKSAIPIPLKGCRQSVQPVFRLPSANCSEVKATD
jgi:hypothetical protein